MIPGVIRGDDTSCDTGCDTGCDTSIRPDREPLTSCSLLLRDTTTADEQQASKLLQRAEAFGDMNVCYILDGLLSLYCVVLTVLYCRLRMCSDFRSAVPSEKQPADGGVYAGLSSRSSDTYETIRVEKKPIV
ncbi:high affinity immunoglobulin epsilon receptor subunit gamma-like isoform X2 [Embiotoca jacksoni]|uniref:high affinity immunoglobulin epsilon receptor subunit gamma-like isoform X2 n=1 Tax=Embiotoca jacksoni TaxID=100190 RepID=UPI003703CBD7